MRSALLGGPALLLASLVAPALSAVVTYNWNITYVNVNPDGLFERRAIGVNNAFPPPAIEVVYNDTLVINVVNSLDIPTSLHSHGLFQNGTGFMDGPTMVTQCGIPPGANFTYTIPIQQYGTYWIHAHNAGQYVDGLRAPLIIHALPENYHYDQEYTIAITDWYHSQHQDLLDAYLAPSNPYGLEPIPQSGLINNNPSNSTISFTPGKVYRLRVINMSAFTMFHFSIDGHDMQIIEIDGVDVKSQTVTNFPIAAAQRYSVLVQALNNTSHNYGIHAAMETSMFERVPDGLNTIVNATIVYSSGAPLGDFNFTGNFPSFDDTTLVPVDPVASVPADSRFVLNAAFAVMSDGVNHGMFNNATYKAPKVPTLLTALSLGDDAVHSEAYGNTNAMVLEHMQMVELVINNYDVGMHPFHLHGHLFQVLGRSDENAGPYDPSKPFPEQANPMRRDTIQVPPGGHAVIRFRADNPGVWLFHCHIEWHLQAGLVATFIEAPTAMQKNYPTLPSSLLSQCSAQGMATTGNAAGNKGLDLTGLPSAPTPLVDGFTTKGIVALTFTIVAACLGLGTVIWYSWES